MRILFCGLTGYPSRSSASINRYVAIAEAMAGVGEIMFVDTFLPSHTHDDRWVSSFGLYCVFSRVRPESFFWRNFFKSVRPFVEFLGLVRLDRRRRIGWLNVYTESFFVCAYYVALSKLLGFKTIFHYVEKRTTFPRRSWLAKFNDRILERLCPFMFDLYLTISHTIDNELRAANEKAKSLIVPPLCDFEMFSSVPKSDLVSGPYLMFCGSAAYAESIKFIIASFLQAKIESACSLVLVISGSRGNDLNNAIREAGANVVVLSNLDYSELIGLYKGALGLLAPLRPIMQDEARFPQKICEYLAAGGPLITTNVGEVPYYFADFNNALVATDYSVRSFSEKLALAVSCGENLHEIKANGYRLGMEKFSISAYRRPLEELLRC